MGKSILRRAAGFVLASFSVAAFSASVVPVFRVSSVTADDAGGIYNNSPVDVTVVIKNSGTGSGDWQAALFIPNGYSFVDQKPCGGTVQPKPSCRDGKALPGSAFFLLWTDGTDGMGTGNTLAPGATSTCTVHLIANTVTPNDVAVAQVYDAPRSRCATNFVDQQSYTFATTAGPTTDMQFTIDASKSSAAVGSTVDYTLTASNIGRQDSPTNNVTFNFPATLSVVPKSCNGASTTGGQSINWSAGSVAFGSSATCVLTGTVLSGAGSVATVTGQLTLGALITDSNPNNNSATNSVALTAAPAADVSTQITANKGTLMPGDNVTFTLLATNAGPQDATSTQVTANFASQLKLLSATCASGTPSSPITWNIGTLVANGTQTCTVQAQLNPTTVASVSASDTILSAVGDPVPTNNSDSLTIPVQQPGNTQVANLAVHLGGASAGHTYAPGEQLQLGVNLTNTTVGADATGVVVSVHVPNNGDLSNLVASCGNFDASGNLRWTVGTLIGGAQTSCSISATVAGHSRTIPVTARVDSDVVGDDLSQLMDSLLVPVNPLPRRISVTTSGAPTSRDSTHVVLSGDGSVALFQSLDPNLVGGNANANGSDIYRVLADGSVRLENMDGSGHQLTGTSSLPTLSGDGSVLAFNYSTSKTLHGKAGLTGAMWGGPSGQPKHQLDTGMNGAAPNGSSSGAPSVSSNDGSKKLVFCSSASNLVNGDGNGANDIFLVDPANANAQTLLVSTDSNGAQLQGDSCEPKISADGNKVVFTISAPNLYGTSARQVVRKDLVTGKLEVMSSVGGAFANADSSEPTISGDGSVVAFTSAASNLDALGAPVGGHEVFVSLAQNGDDGASRIVRRVRSGDGTVPNGASDSAQVSNDGAVLVMHTLSSNFFGVGKALGTPACGTVMMSMNFFSPSAMGSTLCGGSTSSQNPSISGDGTTVAFDANAPQPGTSSNNSNAYTQPVGTLDPVGKSIVADDFSGQWFDSNQSGHGLVIDVLPPQADNSRIMSVIWFVYLNGQPTWLLGAAAPHAAGGADAGKVTVNMDLGIFQGRSFPLGEPNASVVRWGNLTLTFSDSNTAQMTWTSSYPGFNSGTMALTHFLPVGYPRQDPAGAQVRSCYSGNWKEPDKSGHGFEFEVIPSSPPVLAVDWFTYTPSGAPVWLSGSGTISGNTAQMTLGLIDGSGAQFPPKFNTKTISVHAWGTATFTFSDSTHGHMTWTSTFPGYGQGAIDLVPLFGLEQRGCL